ncbi:MAG: hypothetical protein U0133_18150 [Gemmatimonadales bacterium]
MARIVSHSGKVSRISYALPGRKDGDAVPRRPAYLLDFLVNDHPARYRGLPVVGNGDFVVVAGVEADGVLTALAIRNRSTGVDYGGPSPLLYIVLAVALLAGLLTLASGVGLGFLAGAAALGLRLRRELLALAMVRTRVT